MPTLADVVHDIERHAASGGWDQPPALYALVPTGRLREEQPELAAQLGLAESEPDGLTPLRQDRLPADVPLETLLERIAWPESVAGCALVLERIMLDGADEPPDGADPAEWAARQPGREDVRMVAAVLRDGSRHSALRMRAHDSDDQVLSGPDLIPALTAALAVTLRD
ncbi:PPA1309 family protein [Allonocardiopsis opalescens]|uniref:PPA1309 family protein n=1 Tax=Allonocardiopsis opalescens TaxID=1144618 RepID=UPI000D05F927|nr:PPA1309 family protein [Allonocardiopsis opalescens]